MRILILMLTITACITANEWKSYFVVDKSVVCSDGNNIWIGTEKGVIKFNKETKEKIIYNTYNSELPNNEITAIEVDPIGNKWIGTRSGLVKFDNTEWTLCSTGLGGDFISQVWDIAFDKAGVIWLGGELGLAKFNGTTWEMQDSLNASLFDNEISEIGIDNENNKWLCSKSGLVKYHNNSWQVFDTSNSDLPNNRVFSVSIDQDNNKWITTNDNGISKFNDTAWITYDTVNSALPGNDIYSIVVDSSGTIWGGTKGGFSVRFDGANWIPLQISKNSITSISIDKFGDRWFGTYGNEFVKVEENSYQIYYSGNIERPSVGFRNLLIDNLNNKWLTSNTEAYNRQLIKFDNNNWQVIIDSTNPTKLAISSFKDIAIDQKSSIWLTTGADGRILKVNDDSVTEWWGGTFGFGSDAYFTSIVIDSADNKWIGASWDGLGFIDSTDTIFTVFDTTNTPLVSQKIESITIDQLGNKWFGTRNEIAKFNGSEWTIYNSDNSELLNMAYEDITIDNNGGIWFTDYDKIGFFNGVSCTTFTGYGEVRGITIDPFNNKWFSTQKGVVKFNDTSWVVYDTTNSGLLDNSIISIAIDSTKNKWILHSNGISVFNETGVVSIKNSVQSSKLKPNLPSIKCENSVLTYSLPRKQSINLSILNLKGQNLLTVQNDVKNAGFHQIEMSSLNISNGFYIARLKAGSQIVATKFLITK